MAKRKAKPNSVEEARALCVGLYHLLAQLHVEAASGAPSKGQLTQGLHMAREMTGDIQQLLGQTEATYVPSNETTTEEENGDVPTADETDAR